MKRVITGSEEFSVRYKGQVYNDAKRDGFGHIRFGGNEFEFVPKGDLYSYDHIIVHGFKPSGNGYVHTSRKHRGSIEILDN